MLGRLLLGGILGLFSFEAAGQVSCGEQPKDVPPDVQQTIKTDAEGKAQLFTKLLGDINVKGKVEVSKNEMYQKYKNIDKSQIDRYMIWVSCQNIMFDKELTATEKNELWIAVYHELVAKTKEDVQAVVNTNYLAALVGKEQFTEQLPRPLVSSGFAEVLIGDASAARRLSAVQIKLAPNRAGVQKSKGGVFFGDDMQIFAHVEIYPTKQDASERSNASKDLLVKRYGTGLETMSADSFCVSGVSGSAFWTCAGYRGFAYAEVTLSPGANAYLGVATSVVGALLRYTDKMTALATK
jgi:hypothetical protein